MEGEPSERELRAILEARTGPVQALIAGAKLAGQTAGVGLPLTLAFGLLSGLGAVLVVDLAARAAAAAPATTELGGQLAGGLAGFCLLYAIVQFPKRERATRASWWPALFAAPAALVAGGLMVVHSGQARQMGPVVVQLMVMGWSLLWGSFGGAAAAIGWILAGRAALDRKPFSFGEALSAIQARTLDVAGAHGAKVHAVTIGMQVLLPGILYALQLAFVDMVAVLDPDKASLRRSGQLTSGMRGRLFRLLLLQTLVGQVASFAIFAVGTGQTAPDQLVEAGWSFLMDPSAATPLTQISIELTWAALTWLGTMAVFVLYVEREGQVKARNELKKRPAPVSG